MLEKRKFLYGRRIVNDTIELDYLVSDIPKMDLDVEKVITVDGSTAFRPDLLSKFNYDSFQFGWLIMDFNDIIDPFEELYEGKQLSIPNLDQYLDFFNKSSKVSKERNTR